MYIHRIFRNVYIFMNIHRISYGYLYVICIFIQYDSGIYIIYTSCTFHVCTSNAHTCDIHGCIYIYEYSLNIVWIYVVCIFIQDDSCNIHNIYVMYISCMYGECAYMRHAWMYIHLCIFIEYRMDIRGLHIYSR